MSTLKDRIDQAEASKQTLVRLGEMVKAWQDFFEEIAKLAEDQLEKSLKELRAQAKLEEQRPE